MTSKEKIIPYYQSVKFLRQKLRPNTVAYFDELIDQYKKWKKNPDAFFAQTGVPFRGVFFLSRSDIAKNTNLKKGAQLAAEGILKDLGLIEVFYQVDHPNWYKINHAKLRELYNEYKAEKALKKEEEQKAQLPFNYDEMTADYQELDDFPYENQTTPNPETGVAPIQNADVNKNTNKNLKNKNVSNSTYVPDGTESIDSGNKNIKNSCIKEESFVYRPPSHKTSDEVQQIVNEYNAAMGLKEASGDYAFVKAHLEDFKKIRKYLTPSSIEYAWRNFSDKTARELDTKRLCVIDRYGVFKPFLNRHHELYAYFADSWDNRLNKVFKQYRTIIDELLAPEKLHVNIVGELAYPSGETADGKGYRKKRIEIYKQHIEPKLLNDEDLEDMIIDLEVPEWIV